MVAYPVVFTVFILLFSVREGLTDLESFKNGFFRASIAVLIRAKEFDEHLLKIIILNTARSSQLENG